jgi:hypothetical protein
VCNQSAACLICCFIHTRLAVKIRLEEERVEGTWSRGSKHGCCGASRTTNRSCSFTSQLSPLGYVRSRARFRSRLFLLRPSCLNFNHSTEARGCRYKSAHDLLGHRIHSCINITLPPLAAVATLVRLRLDRRFIPSLHRHLRLLNRPTDSNCSTPA